jgi:outer membrane biosynthesis protein TonB
MKLEIEFTDAADLLSQVTQLLGTNPIPEEASPEPEPAPEPKKKRAPRKKKAAAEPEPAPEPEPEEPSNVTPIAAKAEEIDEDAVKQKFRELVSADYDAGLAIMNKLDCASFDDAVQNGKLAELAAALS